MTNLGARREAASPYGEWDASVDALLTYRYLASRPRWIDRTHADNQIRLRPDLRTSAGAVLAAPLAIAMLDTAGINVDRIWILALTQIDVEILDPAVDVGEVLVVGQVIKEARSQIFTEARIYDGDDQDRPIGFGTANWSVICPTPEGHIYPEPGQGAEGVADVPLWQAYTGRRRRDGLIEIPSLRPEIGTERLHHGPMLVITETAALEAAAAALGTEALAVEHLAMTIVAPGRSGPFVATPVFVAAQSQAAGCRVELRDQGRENRLVASAFVRMRAAEEPPC
jgi:acyl-coenzyme A thioesterase PaaI-like protein